MTIETELIKHLWPPDGEQPTTADPVIELTGGQASIRCSTAGASIAYRIRAAGQKWPDRWQLYTEPVELPDGSRLQAQAIRLGWRKSKTVMVGGAGRQGLSAPDTALALHRASPVGSLACSHPAA